jgi:hypothetical protein
MPLPAPALVYIEANIPGTAVSGSYGPGLERARLEFPRPIPADRAQALVAYLCRYTDYTVERIWWNGPVNGTLLVRRVWLLHAVG